MHIHNKEVRRHQGDRSKDSLVCEYLSIDSSDLQSSLRSDRAARTCRSQHPMYKCCVPSPSLPSILLADTNGASAMVRLQQPALKSYHGCHYDYTYDFCYYD